MKKKELIELAANSKQLKSYCKNLCQGRDIHNDLFQEFLLILCGKSENFLLGKFENISFISYCKFVIYKMNLDRFKANKRVNTKHPLSERCINNNMLNLDEQFDELDLKIDEYNSNIDFNFNKTIEFLEKTPSVKKYQVAILFNSITKTTKEISELIETPQRQVIYQNNKLKELIRQNVTI